MLLAIALAACGRRAPSASVSPTAAAPPVATSPPGPRVWPRPLTPEERADFIARAHRAEVNPRRARDGEDLDSPVGWMAQLQEVPYTLCMLQSRDWDRNGTLGGSVDGEYGGDRTAVRDQACG